MTVWEVRVLTASLRKMRVLTVWEMRVLQMKIYLVEFDCAVILMNLYIQALTMINPLIIFVISATIYILSKSSVDFI